MEKTTVHSIRVGVTNCYLIGGKGGWVLVDTSGPRAHRRILKTMQRLGITPGELKLIILTHGHFDHIGSAATLRSATGAKILIHQLDSQMLERGDSNLPKAFTRWGRCLNALVPVLDRLTSPTPARADIVLDRETMLLNEYGIDGELLHTPGHTQGSLSVLLSGGEAFVGDLAFNGSIFCRRPRFVLGQDLDQTKGSWRMLLARGVETVYPAHGRSFPAKCIAELVTAVNSGS